MSSIEIAPLRPEDADEMFAVLSDPRIYAFLDEVPPRSVDALRARYRRLAIGGPADGTEVWLNWVIRDRVSGVLLGYVQATISKATQVAEVAYVLAPSAWGKGQGRQAVSLMLRWLEERLNVSRFLARVHPDNQRSLRLLEWFRFRAHGDAQPGEDIVLTLCRLP